MGVDVRFEDLRPIECDGSTYERHCEIVKAIEGQVVAIDASQWVFQAYQGARSREAQGLLAFSAAIRLSAVTLIFDRVTQVLRYGGHPVVVLDGHPPAEKAHAAHWTGRGPFQIHEMVYKLCAAMGVCCLRAPGEGEALCAALNDSGIADVCFTSDVIDIFFFGARKVMRSVSKVDQTKAKFLTHYDPPGSSFAVVNTQVLVEYVGPGVKKGHRLQEFLKDVILFYAALIGTDYNAKGLPTFGKEKAKAVTHFVYEHWQQSCVSDEEEHNFLDFALLVVAGKVDMPSGNKTFITFLKKAAEETRQGCTFLNDLETVIKVVHDQRAKASTRARQLQRDDVIWTGKHVNHQQLIKVLIEANVEQEQENGVNGVLSRVMKLEAERMLRLGEESDRRPLLRIESIAKPKDVKKWQKGQEMSSQPPFYQYLLKLKVQHDCDIRNDEAKATLVRYAEESKTWRLAARVARESAIAVNWPSMLDEYRQRCDEKHRKARRPAKTGKSAAQWSKFTPTAQGGVGSVSHVRTSHGTYHIRKFLVGDEVPAPTNAALDIITAQQPPRAGDCRQGLLVNSDDHPVLRAVNHKDSTRSKLCAERNTIVSEVSEDVPVRRSEVKCGGPVATVPFQTIAAPCSARASSDSPVQLCRGSQRSQQKNVFANMPDVIKKQPDVFFNGPPESAETAQYLPRATQPSSVSPSLSPEKRDRVCIRWSTRDRSEVLPRSAPIDLTLSSDDEQDVKGQDFLVVRDNASQHETPKKRRSSGFKKA